MGQVRDGPAFLPGPQGTGPFADHGLGERTITATNGDCFGVRDGTDCAARMRPLRIIRILALGRGPPSRFVILSPPPGGVCKHEGEDRPCGHGHSLPSDNVSLRGWTGLKEY